MRPTSSPSTRTPVDPAATVGAAIAADGLARPPVALYVHVPYCLSVCPYCDFVVYAAGTAGHRREREGLAGGGPLDAYLHALLVELDLRADLLDALFGLPGSPGLPGPPDSPGPPGAPALRRPLESVYLGGGTPSLLPPAAVERLLGLVHARFGLAAGAEVTIEANPGARDRGDLAGFHAAGVTRLSLGAQSLDAAELRALGRRHAPDDVRAALALASRAGFAECSVDLLYDVPGQTPASWRRTLEGALELGVDHVSAYALTLDDPDVEGLTGPDGDHLPVSRGARAWRERARPAQDDDRAADLYEIADEVLGAAGLAWYEISNWARPGHESRHNLAYWRREPYEALGVGAHAFDGGSGRRWNGARVERYLAALLPEDGAPRLPPGGSEGLSEDLATRERAILGLRLAAGLAPDLVADPRVAPAADWALRAGLAEETGGGGIRLTRRGRLLSNEVFARLL